MDTNINKHSLLISGVILMTLFLGVSFSQASVSTGEVTRSSEKTQHSSYMKNLSEEEKLELREELKEELKEKIAEVCVSRAEIRESRKDMYAGHREEKKAKYAEFRIQLKNKEITISELFQARKTFVQDQRETRKDFLEVSKQIKRGGIKEMKSFFADKAETRGKKLEKFLPALGKARAIKVCAFVKK